MLQVGLKLNSEFNAYYINDNRLNITKAENVVLLGS